MRLSCGAEEERSQINDYLRGRGAASFRRLLGCAPMIVAWVLPCRRSSSDTPPTPNMRKRRRQAGPTLGSHRGHRGRPRRDLHEDRAWIGRELTRQMRAQTRSRARCGFGKTLVQSSRVAQPNGSRLSCGALKKDSFLNLRAPPVSSAC